MCTTNGNCGSSVAEWLGQRTQDLKILGSNPVTARCRGEAYNDGNNNDSGWRPLKRALLLAGESHQLG